MSVSDRDGYLRTGDLVMTTRPQTMYPRGDTYFNAPVRITQNWHMIYLGPSRGGWLGLFLVGERLLEGTTDLVHLMNFRSRT